MSPTQRFVRVQFLDDAAQDLRDIASMNRAVAIEAFRLLRQLDDGDIEPRPLQDFAKTGDLTDCGKLVVAVDGEPAHRIVVRGSGQQFEIIEVVAIQDRSDDLPYLIAGLRLGRIADPIRQSDARRRVARVRKMLGYD